MAGGVNDSLWLKIQRLWVAGAGQMIDSQDRCIVHAFYTEESIIKKIMWVDKSEAGVCRVIGMLVAAEWLT